MQSCSCWEVSLKKFKVYGGEASLTALELIGNKWLHMVSFKVRKGSRRFLQRGPYTCGWTTCCVKYVWGGVFLSQSHRYLSHIKQRSKEDEFTFWFSGIVAYCMPEWFSLPQTPLAQRDLKLSQTIFVAVSGVKLLHSTHQYKTQNWTMSIQKLTFPKTNRMLKLHTRD